MKCDMGWFRTPATWFIALLTMATFYDVDLAEAAESKSGDSTSGERARRVAVEIFASSLSEDGVSEESLGLRGSYFISERFAIEGNLSRFDINPDLEIWLLDVSAKFYLRPQSRAPLYFVGGPGKTFQSVDDLDDGPLNLHVGFGTEVSLSNKLYFRPELRARWVEDDFDTLGGDLSLGFGWTF